jgi:hypothetical protein
MSDSQESRKEAIRSTVVDCIGRSGVMLRSYPIDNKLAQAISEAVVARVDSIDKAKQLLILLTLQPKCGVIFRTCSHRIKATTLLRATI